MSSQIFKTSVPKHFFYTFLESAATKKSNYYIFTKTSFKTVQYQELIEPFLLTIKDHYFPSKQKYVTRKMNYKNFVTILRQICKHHHIAFTSTIKYDKSTYDISYSIFFDSEQ
jgi:tRNA G18 (ribose-2'-O)-methylase SpoU